MKNLKTFLLIAVFALGMSSIVNAQKIGHIDTDKLIASMPQTAELQAELERLERSYKDEITIMAKNLEAKIKKYSAEQSTQTQTVNQQRRQEVEQERARIAQSEQAAYQDIQKRQSEKLGPILDRARKAIKDVAYEKGIVYVLDSSPGKGLLVFERGEDIYEAVKAKLGF